LANIRICSGISSTRRLSLGGAHLARAPRTARVVEIEGRGTGEGDLQIMPLVTM
jgi:hypothetical protein